MTHQQRDDVPASLMDRMRAYAESHASVAAEFLSLADALDAAIESGDPLRQLGCWARARRRWCEETGEALV